MDKVDMDSQDTYKLLSAGGSKFKLTADAVRQRPFRTATVCLGLLCVLLLAGVIEQGVRFRKSEQHLNDKYNALTKKRDDTQTNLNAVLKERNDQQSTQARLQSSNADLQREKDRVSPQIDELRRKNDALAKERDTLKARENKLQAEKSALTKETGQFKAKQIFLQKYIEALTKSRQLWSTSYNSTAKQVLELQGSYSSAVKERDAMQNKYNNVSRVMEQALITYESLLAEFGKLKDTHNATKSQIEQLEVDHGSNKNELAETQTYNRYCQITVDLIQRSSDDLLEEINRLRAGYDNVTADRDQLNRTQENCTIEVGELQDRQGELAAQRNYFHLEVERIKGTNAGGTIAPVPVIPTGPQQSLAVPYDYPLRKGVYDKLQITINGTVNPNPQRFWLDFMTAGGDIAFRFNPRFNHHGSRAVICNSMLWGLWGEKMIESTFPFTAGQPFQIKITCTNQEFLVSVDGTNMLSFRHRMTNLQSITRLHITDDLTLSSVTETTLP